jgi:hypothetical protein
MLIYKYQLNRDGGQQVVKMPPASQILSFGLDPQDDPCIWAAVNETCPNEEEYVFHLCFTGQEVPHLRIIGLPNALTLPRFIGTCTSRHALVIHCFYLGRKNN